MSRKLITMALTFGSERRLLKMLSTQIHFFVLWANQLVNKDSSSIKNTYYDIVKIDSIYHEAHLRSFFLEFAQKHVLKKDKDIAIVSL